MKSLTLLASSLALLGAMSAHAATRPVDLLGAVVPASLATRTVQIGPTTRSVNVSYGETVRFVSEGQTFAFDFNGAADATSFDLQRVAPQGMVGHRVIAYVRPSAEDPATAPD